MSFGSCMGPGVEIPAFITGVGSTGSGQDQLERICFV